MKMEWGLQAKWLVSMDPAAPPVQENMFLAFDQGKIALIEKFKPKHKKSVKKFIEGDNHVAIPGLVNGHSHLPMSLFRGVEDDANLRTWLFHRIFPLEAKFVSKPFVQLGAEIAALESTRFGVTTSNDMYFYTEASARVWDQAGLRGIFSQAFADFPLPEDAVLGPDHMGRFEKLYTKYSRHPRIKMALGPHAPYSCGDDLLRKIADRAHALGCPVHIHLCETEFEVTESFKKHGKSPVKRLLDLGVLSENTICAHGIHFSKEDLAILKANKVSVIHNPDSNTKLASGVCPIDALMENRIRVGLGTDGVASNNNLNMIGAMNLAAKLQKLHTKRPDFLPTLEVLHMATLGGAQAIGLGHEIGSLEVGKRADVVLLNFKAPHLVPANNVISHLIYACTGTEVEYVFCDGELLMKPGKFMKMNADKILKNSGRYQKQILAELSRLKAESAV